jgi:hypothetical protein
MGIEYIKFKIDLPPKRANPAEVQKIFDDAKILCSVKTLADICLAIDSFTDAHHAPERMHVHMLNCIKECCHTVGQAVQAEYVWGRATLQCLDPQGNPVSTYKIDEDYIRTWFDI